MDRSPAIGPTILRGIAFGPYRLCPLLFEGLRGLGFGSIHGLMSHFWGGNKELASSISLQWNRWVLLFSSPGPYHSKGGHPLSPSTHPAEALYILRHQPCYLSVGGGEEVVPGTTTLRR